MSNTSAYTEGVTCELHTEGRCPRSDIKFLSEHGNNADWAYRSYQCRTCKHLQMVWNQTWVGKAKKQELDKELMNLGSDGPTRWGGFDTQAGKIKAR